MFASVILAAGKSRRMGVPKAFLRWETATFLETMVSRLKEAGVQSVYVVVRSDLMERARSLVASMGARILTNDDAKGEGPISSIRAALADLPEDCWGLMVCPVDHPGVERTTYATLLQEARDNPGQIVVPVCQGRPGHPVLFPAEVFGELSKLKKGLGADAVIAEQAHRVVKIDVSDANVLRDIDTAEDYRAATGRSAEESE